MLKRNVSIYGAKPKLPKPKKLAGGFTLDCKYSENLESLCSYTNKRGKYVNFYDELFMNKGKIEAEVGEKFKEKPVYAIQYDTTLQFFLEAIIDVNCEEEQIKEYMDLCDYTVKHSKTIRKIHADIYTINAYTKSVLEKNKRLYRGGSIYEVLGLEIRHGKTGYHERCVPSMKGKNFTSTSIFPNVALYFTENGCTPTNEGVLLEYDVSKMSESEVKVVQYDLRGRCRREDFCKNKTFWPLEKFGGYYDTCHIHQAEVHLKQGSIPVVTRAWINSNLNKCKKFRAESILTCLYPDVKIYQNKCIG